MKSRLIWFTILSVIWLNAFNLFIRPATTLVRQSVAVATVQNSDAAYIAQQSVERLQSPLWPFGVVIVLALLFFLAPLVSLLTRKSNPTT